MLWDSKEGQADKGFWSTRALGCVIDLMISLSLGVRGFLSVLVDTFLSRSPQHLETTLLPTLLLMLTTAKRRLESRPRRVVSRWLWILFSICRVWGDFQNHISDWKEPSRSSCVRGALPGGFGV